MGVVGYCVVEVETGKVTSKLYSRLHFAKSARTNMVQKNYDLPRNEREAERAQRANNRYAIHAIGMLGPVA